MYEIVDFINYWGTLVGLIVSAVTMLNTFRLDKKLKQKLDLADLNKEIDDINAKLDEFISLVSEHSKLSGKHLADARELISKLINKYPSIDKKIKLHLEKCNSFVWESVNNKTVSNPPEFLKSLSYIRENLIKEIRP